VETRYQESKTFVFKVNRNKRPGRIIFKTGVISMIAGLGLIFVTPAWIAIAITAMGVLLSLFGLVMNFLQ